MLDINVRIINRIKELDPDVSDLALAAIQSAEMGLSEIAIEERLQTVVRQIVRKRMEISDSE